MGSGRFSRRAHLRRRAAGGKGAVCSLRDRRRWVLLGGEVEASECALGIYHGASAWKQCRCAVDCSPAGIEVRHVRFVGLAAARCPLSPRRRRCAGFRRRGNRGSASGRWRGAGRPRPATPGPRVRDGPGDHGSENYPRRELPQGRSEAVTRSVLPRNRLKTVIVRIYSYRAGRRRNISELPFGAAAPLAVWIRSRGPARISSVLIEERILSVIGLAGCH